MRDDPAMAADATTLANAVAEGASHIDRHLGFASRVVSNNHLVSEAVGLLFAVLFVPSHPRAASWRARAMSILTREAERQFPVDGAYLQASHNYQRTATDAYVLTIAALRGGGIIVPPTWVMAVDRSVRFMSAHQNPRDGFLPNYGANDGSMFAVLSSRPFSDFRPSLQAGAIAARGQRLYAPGPWDEMALWLFGKRALQVPEVSAARKPVSFARAGYHVLSGDAPGTFAAFRCGTVRERFGQMDMLHLDLWWRGHNVLVDGGSYGYADESMHRYLKSSASHNTIAVDRRDQMVAARRFSTVHLTPAECLRFEAVPAYQLIVGEHRGYKRHEGGAVHRRSVLLAGDVVCIVLDQVDGEGSHDLRLHWLCGDFPFADDSGVGRIVLQTADGPFSVSVFDGAGAALPGDVCVGREEPPRGWLSRRYLQRTPVPSFAVQKTDTPLPARFISILCTGLPEVSIRGTRWFVRAAGVEVSCEVGDDGLRAVEVAS